MLGPSVGQVSRPEVTGTRVEATWIKSSGQVEGVSEAKLPTRKGRCSEGALEE